MLTNEQTRLLKQTFEERDRAYYETLPDEHQLKEISFSDKFQSRMKKSMRRSEWKIYPLMNTLSKRVACIIVAVMVLAGVTTFSVSSLRQSFVQFCVNTYDTFAQLVFRNYSDNVDFFAIIPAYIPEGYKQISCNETEQSIQIEYRNEEDQRILYTQKLATENKICVDVECDVYEKVILQQNTEALLTRKYDCLYIVFQKDQYIIEITGETTEAELITMANSIIG